MYDQILVRASRYTQSPGRPPLTPFQRLSCSVAISLWISVGCTYDGSINDPGAEDDPIVAPGESELELSRHSIYIHGPKVWPSSNIPVCVYAHGGTYNTEQTWIREALADSWEAVSAVRFTGWGACQDSDPVVKLRLFQGDSNSKTHGFAMPVGIGLGIDTKLVGTNLDGGPQNVSVSNWRDAAGNPVTCAPGFSREACVKSTAIHEFGHVLGYAHEQNRSDRPSSCTDAPSGADGTVAPGLWDLFSVINYCNPVRNGAGRLSPRDIIGHKSRYAMGASPLLFYKTNGSVGTAATGTLSSTGAYTNGFIYNGWDPNWTHIVGTRNLTVLFYNQFTGVAATGKVDNAGNYSSFQVVNIGGAGWSHITSLHNGFVFLYRQATGTAAIGRIDAKGAYQPFGNLMSGFANFTHVVGLQNGALFLFNIVSGTGFVSRVNAQGGYQNVTGQINVGSWSHVTAVNESSLFFMNNSTRVGRVALLTDTVSDVPGGGGTINFVWKPTISGLGNWTAVVGARNGALFFYNPSSSTAATAVVSYQGNYAAGVTVGGLSPWSMITAM
jgi:hypothetical protein